MIKHTLNSRTLPPDEDGTTVMQIEVDGTVVAEMLLMEPPQQYEDRRPDLKFRAVLYRDLNGFLDQSNVYVFTAMTAARIAEHDG